MASAIDLLIAQPKPLDVGGFDRGFQAAQGRKAMRLENLMGEEKLAAAQFKNERAPIEAEQSDMAFEMEVQEYIRKQVASENAAERQRNIEQSRVVAELGPQGALQFAQANPGLFDPDDLEILQTNPKTAELIAKGYLLMANETPKPMSDIGKANQDVKWGFATQQQVDQKFGGGLVEVYDPSSPTGTRMVPRSEAAGMPGKPGSGMSVSVGPDGSVQLMQGPGVGGMKAPSGYQYRPDGKLEPIPGGPADKVSGEMAGKLAALTQSMNQDIPAITQKLFSGDLEKGAFNRELLIRPPGTQGVGEARNIRQAVERALTAVLRMESGAAVPDTEVERYLGQYMPSILDTDEGARAKIIALRERINLAMQYAVPGGKEEKGGGQDDPLGIR